jgi:hypothetical protein
MTRLISFLIILTIIPCQNAGVKIENVCKNFSTPNAIREFSGKINNLQEEWPNHISWTNIIFGMKRWCLQCASIEQKEV